ncbi:MAG: TM0106 family RecB-like putative nuclease [Proteobacteria bacterium]|nr:TM0106 family RecB-like putative nuclease [Pseudomonadota bacterium]
MYLESGLLTFSPSDLTLYMRSPFASWMEHFATVYPEKVPKADEQDPMRALLSKKGITHEEELLSQFQAQGLTVVNLKSASDPVSATLSAMQSGADVIFQAALAKSPFKGYADFLVKVNGDSLLGTYHYEILDTKLAKTARPEFIVQLCCYIEMLETIQGRRAENMIIALGNNEKLKLRVDDYFYYYQNLKNSFIDIHNNFSINNAPDPGDSSSWGRWESFAEMKLLEMDHLSQIAAITKSQIKKLNKLGIKTMQELVDTKIENLEGFNPDVFQRLKAQARIQKQSVGQEIPLFEVLSQEMGKKKGLALVPPASSADVFFDIEGYPLEEGGLEYLWGCSYFNKDGVRDYIDFWAHDHDQEKNCFKAFIAWAYERWQKDPNMHIYHYANYEINACRKLMGRYGVCEYEVDQLLRNEVFVDLYKIVKCSILLGEPKYSIKNIEHLYRAQRETNVISGGDSVVVYDGWRENPDGDTWQTSKILNDIRNYNRDDCDSTQELVDWLRNRQREHKIQYLGKSEVIEPEQKEDVTERIELRDRLLKKSEQLKSQGDIELSNLTSNLAWSLEFHRRESKPVFWKLFDRLGQTEEELLYDLDCLANCIRTDRSPFKPTSRARNLAYEYKFDTNQEFKGISDNYYILGEETEEGRNKKVTVIKEQSNFDQGHIVLQSKEEPPRIVSLIPDEFVPPQPIPESIYQQVKAFEQGKLGDCAIIDFLKRATPRILGHQSGAPVVSSQDEGERLQQIINVISNLDNSYLAIQGPPGAGKTYTCKHVIAELLKRNMKIGISSNSHKAINNLLIGTVEYCKKERIQGHFFCTKKTEEVLEQLGVSIITNNEISQNLKSSCVIGTTAWGFARDDLAGKLDYLFIDEAGQVSVANLIAMSRSTKNIILIGDQMQLGQPSQGSHPDDSGLSILEYLLHDRPTIPDDMGVFLGKTHRMHSAINQFISKAIYEGKLESDPGNDTQKIDVPNDYEGILNKEAGIVYVPISHEGNTQSSNEEVEKIVKLAKELLGRTYTDKKGKQKIIEWDDILFVAPYNHQVNKLKYALGERARVGSVDKFQGQEAPIVFLSMCASNANDSPRGMDFLFNENRINVAISRAQCLAIVVYSPSLTHTFANNVQQASMMNVFCMLVQQ